MNETQNGIFGLAECLACEAAFHKVQGLFRNEFFQHKLMSVVDDLCYITDIAQVLALNTCNLFIYGSTPTIME